MRHVAAVAVAALVLLAGTPRAAADPSPVTYRPPVDGPVVDAFRPPATAFGAGNLGLEYATRPGAAVRAAAAGEVVFAGQVGGSLHVVVLHADGIRTSYSFLDAVTVARGQRVGAGEQVGMAGRSVHFGARAGDAYVDPAVLLGAGRVHVRLVPDTLRRAGSEADERSRLSAFVRLLGRAGRGAVGLAAGGAKATAEVGATAVGWARDGAALAGRMAIDEVRERLEELRLLAHYARALIVPDSLERTLVALRATAEWLRDRATCTRADAPAPRLTERHLVVEVAGLGSHQAKTEADRSQGGAVFEVDTRAVGWADADVRRFSYRGGTTSERGYTAADTQGDIREAGRLLRDLLERLQYEQPGMPIDIVAHSQGGLVVRSALGDELDTLDPRTPHIASVVTLGTPHHGANAATMGVLLDHTRGGHTALRAAGAVKPAGIDPTSTSVRQLAETSKFIRDLNDRPLPDGVRFTSIAARGDVIVPSPRAHLDGATNVIVDVAGVATDHDHLPGSAAATREIALAVNGRGPTCESLTDAIVDADVGHALGQGVDAVAVGAWILAARADA
jgi:murein DD-endopeptidase MepM/ murein hydrolase activator NlpD/alpha-beta hydrolase superfamily lysophospholipase